MQKKILWLIGLLLAFGLAWSGFSLAQAPQANPDSLAKVAPQVLEATQNGGQSDFLVLLTQQADLSGADNLLTKQEKGRYVYETLYQTAQRTQAPLSQWLTAEGVPHRSFYVVNALWVQGDDTVVRQLAQRPDVARLEANPRIKQNLPLPQSDSYLPERTPQSPEPGIQHTNAPAVWAKGITGTGVVVGGQDTGYDWDHRALKNQYRGWDGSSVNHDYNWHDGVQTGGNIYCEANSPRPCDDNNHGTHTMGTAIGWDGGGNQVGMAPGAEWIGCRNMDAGVGSPATYLSCFEFFLAPFPVDGSPAQGNPDLAPDVTVNSWTCPGFEGCNWDTLQAATEAQRAAGIFTVAAAGNSGSSCQTVQSPPGIYDSAYTVGALVTGSDNIAGFSGRGGVAVDGSQRVKPDISAPGTGVRSAIRNGNFASLSGTSMATPHVAGAVALLWSAAPHLKGDIATTEAILNQAAFDIPSFECGEPGQVTVPNNVYGHGRLDVLAAVELALQNSPRFSHTTPVYATLPVTFTNLSTATMPVSYTWDFGDGSKPIETGTALLPVQHSFAEPGRYTVSLRASHGFTSESYIRLLDVLSPQPQADFAVSAPLLVNRVITFSNLSQGLAPLTFTWQFGDGSPLVQTLDLRSVTHTYAVSGSAVLTGTQDAPGTMVQPLTYTVYLTAENAYGQDVVSQALQFYFSLPSFEVYLPLILR